jgi:hypothetical protein
LLILATEAFYAKVQKLLPGFRPIEPMLKKPGMTVKVQMPGTFHKAELISTYPSAFYSLRRDWPCPASLS